MQAKWPQMSCEIWIGAPCTTRNALGWAGPAAAPVGSASPYGGWMLGACGGKGCGSIDWCTAAEEEDASAPSSGVAFSGFCRTGREAGAELRAWAAGYGSSRSGCGAAGWPRGWRRAHHASSKRGQLVSRVRLQLALAPPSVLMAHVACADADRNEQD